MRFRVEDAGDVHNCVASPDECAQRRASDPEACATTYWRHEPKP
ncbi:hypothetical protein HMPREF1868_00779 [Olsenella sp. DNF00959]|nr:hypothetical protein HMPREF1868_00779 [Olsenella sp. DNF00959]